MQYNQEMVHCDESAKQPVVVTSNIDAEQCDLSHFYQSQYSSEAVTKLLMPVNNENSEVLNMSSKSSVVTDEIYDTRHSAVDLAVGSRCKKTDSLSSLVTDCQKEMSTDMVTSAMDCHSGEITYDLRTSRKLEVHAHCQKPMLTDTRLSDMSSSSFTDCQNGEMSNNTLSQGSSSRAPKHDADLNERDPSCSPLGYHSSLQLTVDETKLTDSLLLQVQNARMQALLHGLQLPYYSQITTHRKSFVCNQCGKALSSQHNLRLHETTIHQGLFQFRCPICAKGLRQERDLRGHLANRHDWKKEFQCSICGHEFGYKRNLKQHMTSHHRWNDNKSYSVPSTITSVSLSSPSPPSS